MIGVSIGNKNGMEKSRNLVALTLIVFCYSLTKLPTLIYPLKEERRELYPQILLLVFFPHLVLYDVLAMGAVY